MQHLPKKKKRTGEISLVNHMLVLIKANSLIAHKPINNWIYFVPWLHVLFSTILGMSQDKSA